MHTLYHIQDGGLHELGRNQTLCTFSSNKKWIHMDIGVQVIVDEYKRIVSCFLYD